MGTRRFAPCEILNWADGRCLRAAFYIYFILGGINSASNTYFLLIKSCLVSLCQFEIFQENIINVHFSKASLDPWSGDCFFCFFINLPTGCHFSNHTHFRVCVIALKDTLQIQSNWKWLKSDLRTRTNSRGQRPTPEEKPKSLKWSARLRMFDLTPQHHHAAATNIPAGWEFFNHSRVWGANHLSIFKYADGQSEKTASLMSLWWIFRRWYLWILSFLTREQTCIMALWFSGLKIVMKFSELLKTMISSSTNN